MKIGIDIRHLTNPNPSGVGHYTLQLIHEMAQANPGDRFLLFAAGSKRVLEHLPEFTQPNIKIESAQIPNRILFSLLRLPLGPSLEDFMQEKPDVWLFPNLNLVRTRKPYVLSMHDLSFELYPEFFRRKTLLWHTLSRPRTLCQNARAILAVSESTKRDLTNMFHIDPSKITVTPLGVDRTFTPEEDKNDRKILNAYGIKNDFLLSLCTLEPRKNLPSVIEAFEEIATEHIELQLVLAGGSGLKQEQLTEMITNSPVADRIIVTDYVSQKETPVLFRHATVFLFPSFYEGFGLPCLEAMASGTPVITSFTGSLPEVVADAAIMIDPYNISDLTQALKELLGESQKTPPALQSILSQRGLERAKKFSWKTTAKTTHATLKKCG